MTLVAEPCIRCSFPNSDSTITTINNYFNYYYNTVFVWTIGTSASLSRPSRPLVPVSNYGPLIYDSSRFRAPAFRLTSIFLISHDALTLTFYQLRKSHTGTARARRTTLRITTSMHALSALYTART